MVLNTTNRSTISTAVNIRASIERIFEEILPFIQLNTKESLRIVNKKLGKVYSSIEVFKIDEHKNLLKSDILALEYLQSEVLDFIQKFEKKTKEERLAIAKSLLRTAKTTLETS